MFIEILMYDSFPLIINSERILDIELKENMVEIRYDAKSSFHLETEIAVLPAVYASIKLALTGESSVLQGVGRITVLPKPDVALSSYENLKSLIRLEKGYEHE